MSSMQPRRCLLLRQLHGRRMGQYGGFSSFFFSLPQKVSDRVDEWENKPKTATRPFAPGVLAKAAFAERIEVIPTMISVD